jgi:hypothetical protein
LLIVRSFRQPIATRGILGASLCHFEAFAWRRETASVHFDLSQFASPAIDVFNKLWLLSALSDEITVSD